MEVDKKKLGQKIRSIRINNGLTMEEFGDLFGTSKGTVNNWEKGRNSPNKRNIKKIANLAGIDVDDLLNDRCHRKKVGLYWVSDCGKKLFADPLGFNEFKNFTYCPYCGKKIAKEEIDND